MIPEITFDNDFVIYAIQLQYGGDVLFPQRAMQMSDISKTWTCKHVKLLSSRFVYTRLQQPKRHC